MAEELQKPKTGMKRWVKVLLVVSLALNLLIIGTVAGAMLSKSKWQRHHPPRLDLAVGPLTRALSHEDRRDIGRKMRQAYRQGDKPRADLRAELDGLVADLKAMPFDPAAIASRLGRHRDIFDARFQLGQELLLERLTQMNPEERAAYADRLGEVLDKHRHKHGHKSWKD